MSFERLGTSMIDMEELEKYLKAKAFITESDKLVGEKLGLIEDGVENEEDEKRVALAVSSEERTTVEKAWDSDRLGGRDANEYLLVNDNTDRTASITSNYNKEIAKLRDELYQLRNELAQDGLVTKYAPYTGFYDAFRTKYPVHESETYATVTEDTAVDDANIACSVFIVSEEDRRKFCDGDHVLIYSVSTGKSTVVQIKDASSRHISFEPQAPFAIKRDDMVFRSRGSVIDGQYVFGELIKVQPGNKQYITTSDDDTYTKTFQITKPNTGYATTFKIAKAYQRNYLAKASIKVKKVGQPGSLKAYVINQDNISNWKNPTQAREANMIIAESLPLHVEAALDEHLAEFTFYDPNGNLNATAISSDVVIDNVTGSAMVNNNPNNYPLLKDYDSSMSDGKIRYCLIIEAIETADKDNFYYITMLGDQSDPENTKGVQSNNTLYAYSEQESGSASAALTVPDELKVWDLYYTITLVEAKMDEFTPFDKGIYTAHVNIGEDTATNARLTMRIFREGMFTVDKSAGTASQGALMKGGSITVKGDTLNDTEGFTYSKDREVVVGTTVNVVKDVTGPNSFNVENGMYLQGNDIVYPVNYKVRLKCRKYVWDEKSNDMLSQALPNGLKINDSTDNTSESEKAAFNELWQYKCFDMKLVGVCRDQFKKNEALSDRLIFETDFNTSNIIQDYNDFELEIYWEKSCHDLSSKMIGRIHDITLSLNSKVM